MALTKKADYAFKHTAQIDEPVFPTTPDLKTALDSQAVELRTYINDTLTVEAEALFATKDELVSVVTGDIPDGSLSISKLDFDPATQTELNTHKTSTDHDGRYYTESEVDSLIGGKIDESILTTTGDIIYASGVGAPARKGIGAAYQSLNVNALGTSPEYQASLQSLMAAAGDIVYASGANAPARLALGASGACPVSNGTTIVYGYPDSPSYVASDNVILTANTERIANGSTYSQLKSFTPKYTGTVRLKFEVHGNGEATQVGVGIQYGAIPTGSIGGVSAGVNTYGAVRTADISVTAGQTYILYGKVSAGGYGCYVRNFTVCADKIASAVANSIVD